MSDLISRKALQEWIKDKTFGDIVVASEHNFDCLPSVETEKPQCSWYGEDGRCHFAEQEMDECDDCISRQAALNALEALEQDAPSAEHVSAIFDCEDTIKRLLPVEPEPCGDIGEISDGYHTFNQLYHQRAILFAAIVNQNKGISWKSYKHSDGKYCFDSDGEWFVVGIDTPKGSYTYHYSKEYWDYFKCKELDCGKEWDGHTEADVTRLLSLESEPCSDCISRKAATDRFDLVQSDDKCMGYDDIMDFLSSLPSVEPESKTGIGFLEIRF